MQITQKTIKTSLRVFISFLLLALMLFLAACSAEENIEKKALPKTVDWITISNHDNHIERRFSAIVRPAQTAEISFEVAGKVDDVYVELGQEFKKGDVLAALDARAYALTVKQRQGQLSEAKARLFEAESDFKRKSDLVKDGAVSQSVFDIAKAQFKTAQDQVDIAKSSLELAEKDLADTKIHAPYDGTVAMRHIEPSQRVNVGSAALEIQGDDTLEVSLAIPETLVGQLSIGQVATLNFPALNLAEKQTALISEIGTQANGANAFPITLALIKNVPDLKPGMSAEVSFALKTHQPETEASFHLPVTAYLAGANNKNYIYRINAEQQIEPVPVNIVDLSDQYVIITGDISVGEKIVRAGLPFLYEGQEVRLMGQDIAIYNE